MGVKITQNGQDVTKVSPGSAIRLQADGIFWMHVFFSVIDAERNTYLPNTEVAVDWVGNAWLDTEAPLKVGTYKFYAYNGADMFGLNEFTYFTVSNDVPIPGQPNWTKVLDRTTVAAADYQGKAKLVPFTFSAMPDQFDFINDWLVNHFLDELQAQATANNGSQVLKLRLWRDTSPAWETRYRGELELSTPPGFETPFLVTAIVVVALAAIAYYFIVKPLIGEVIDLVYGPVDPGTGKRPAVPWGTIAIVAVVAAVVAPDFFGGRK
jgi:hypothetical protein